MEELLLILFFLVLVLAFAGAALAYLRLLRAQARKDGEARAAELSQLREQMSRLEQRLLQLGSPGTLSGSERAAAPASQAPAGAQASIEAELSKLGFSKIRVLPAAAGAAVHPGEISVEAMKDQIEYKGRVVLRDGALVEYRLQPSYEVFP